MKRIEQYVANGLMLTGVGLLLRFGGVLWNAWIAGKLGESGIGLFSLITSVYGLAVTFAVSGSAFACSRLTASAIGAGRQERLRGISLCCMCYGLLFGIASGAVLYLTAVPIGMSWLNDARTVSSLRMLSFSLPAVSVSSALSGYFTGVRRLGRSTVVSVAEQLAGITVTAIAVIRIPQGNLELSCLALCLGSVTGSLFALCGELWVWKRDTDRLPSASDRSRNGSILKSVLKTALPIAVSAYLRSGLLTVEHLLIPVGLRRSGADAENALAMYGIIHGMAFSVVLFPQAFTAAFTSLLVPEMAEAQARGDTGFIRRNCARVLRFTLLFAFLCAGLLICFSDSIGRLLFQSGRAGNYIRILSVLIPVMYLDSAVDHVLKGLGEQFYSMCVNIADSACSVIGVWVLLPKYGIVGYLWVLFFCEILNASLSVARLLYLTRVRVRIVQWIAVPVFLSATVSALLHGITVWLPQDGYPALIFGIAAYCLLYTSLLRLFGTVRQHDIQWLQNKLRRKHKTVAEEDTSATVAYRYSDAGSSAGVR